MGSAIETAFDTQIQKGSYAPYIDRVYRGATWFNNLKIGRQVKPRSDFYVVKHFNPCSLIIQEIEAEIWNLVI